MYFPALVIGVSIRFFVTKSLKLNVQILCMNSVDRERNRKAKSLNHSLTSHKRKETAI